MMMMPLMRQQVYSCQYISHWRRRVEKKKKAKQGIFPADGLQYAGSRSNEISEKPTGRLLRLEPSPLLFYCYN
jgi:hypothetical protein